MYVDKAGEEGRVVVKLKTATASFSEDLYN